MPFPLPYLVNKVVHNGSSRHPHRTVYDLNVAFPGLDVSLLECIRGIALIGGNEPRSHLNAAGTCLHYVINVVPGIEPSCCDHRDIPVVFLFKYFHFITYIGNKFFKDEILIENLFLLESEMTSCLGNLPQ